MTQTDSTGRKPQRQYIHLAPLRPALPGRVGLASHSLWILVLSGPEVETAGSLSV